MKSHFISDLLNFRVIERHSQIVIVPLLGVFWEFFFKLIFVCLFVFSLFKEYQKAVEDAEEKVSIATQTYDLVW